MADDDLVVMQMTLGEHVDILLGLSYAAGLLVGDQRAHMERLYTTFEKCKAVHVARAKAGGGTVHVMKPRRPCGS
jgi:hypothetical protein